MPGFSQRYPVRTMKIRLVALFACAALSLRATQPSLTIDLAKPVAPVSPRLYGLMTEEINYSYDGGLYGELVRNRAFLDNADKPVHWTAVPADGVSAKIALDRSQPLNEEIPVSLRVEVSGLRGSEGGIANDGYWGIPVLPRTTYRASFFAKAAAGFGGGVAVAITGEDGLTNFAHARVSGVTGEWHQYEVELKTGDVAPTPHARLTLMLDRPGTVWFGFVSLFPPTWNDRPNGLRRDLMQMLVNMHPKFLRFPGGNYLEGNTLAERFDWKKTIGPIERRPGHESPWGYRSTDGMGLLEFLEWCEDMGGEPVLAVYAGYSLHQEQVAPGADLAPYVQDALDEIEYVSGDVSTKWGAERARNGHPKPFPLHYVEIGNEDYFQKANTYDARFTQFYDAIKARYPALKCISTTPPREGADKVVHSRKPDVIDEHYYNPVDEYLKMAAGKYESYDRQGPEIFVGEWASYETAFPPWNEKSHAEPPTPSLRTAIGDAAFMTEMERNADVVVMHCYAPMLVNVNPGGRQWRPDLIGYNAIHVFGSPSYYAIRMFSSHVGDEILRVTRNDTPVLASATRQRSSGQVFLKLVNPQSHPEKVTLALGGAAVDEAATAITLAAASSDATNSIDAPDAVVPTTTTVNGIHDGSVYSVPANAVVVLTLRAK